MGQVFLKNYWMKFSFLFSLPVKADQELDLVCQDKL